jgi:predicted TIM-barrel fold metal-dependent hydrolase
MTVAQPRILDAHCHVASEEFIPRSFIEGAVTNTLAALAAQGLRPERAKLLDLYLSKLQDPQCEELLAAMAEAGIAGAVLLLPDFTYALRDATLTIAEMYARHRDVLARHPGRFHVFAGVDPRWGRDGLELFERGVREYGFAGMKLYPPCGYRASDRSLYPFYEICAAHRLPVLVHTGGTSPALAFDTARPIFVDEAARAFPAVNFILAHGSTAYVEECVMMCHFRPNVFLDVSAFQSAPVGALRPLFARGITHKILFGTDWPVFRLQGTQKDFVAVFLDPAGPLESARAWERDAFFGGSLDRLLPPQPTRVSRATGGETCS